MVNVNSNQRIEKNKNEKPKCPYCNRNSQVVKIGFRTTKTTQIRRFKCKSCKKTFSKRPIKNITYNPKIIFTAISTYNMGYTKQQVVKLLARKHKIKVPIPTIHSWLKRYQEPCSFTYSLRKHYTINPDTIIFSKKFHHQQVYEFKYHTLKNNIAGKTFPTLKNYLKSLPEKCPDKPFQAGPRCSALRIDLEPKKTTKHNNAPKLTDLALTLAKNNRDRHEKVENFFLINDTATIAIEIPVLIYPNELTKQEQTKFAINIQEPLSGHIDILQVRFNKIHILDYKPDAKRSDRSAAEQLFLYALALSKRTKISINKFTCAYFDDKNYYQFTPSSR